jgi:hypothetical protein
MDVDEAQSGNFARLATSSRLAQPAFAVAPIPLRQVRIDTDKTACDRVVTVAASRSTS